MDLLKRDLAMGVTFGVTFSPPFLNLFLAGQI